MSDTDNQPVSTEFKSIAATVIGAGTVGEQVSEQLGDTFAWLVTTFCHCTPPASVIGLFHTVATGLVLGAALFIHYKIAKLNQQ